MSVVVCWWLHWRVVASLAACMSGSDTDKYMFVLLHGCINPTCDKVKTFRWPPDCPKLSIIFRGKLQLECDYMPLIEMFVKIHYVIYFQA